MAIQFPINPSIGQQFTYGDNTWQWSGVTWDIVPGISGVVSSVGISVPTGFVVAGSPVTSTGVMDITFASGYSLPSSASQSNWNTAYNFVNTFPSQTGNTGKYLSTDGSNLSWASLDALPSQTGNSGKYLTTDGTVASWGTINTIYNSNGTLTGARIVTMATYSLTFSGGTINADRISIGGTSADALLSVYGDTSTWGTASFHSTKGNQVSHIHYGTNGDIYLRSAATAGIITLQGAGGNVLIGTETNGTSKLQVRSNSSSTGNAFLVQNSTPTDLLTIANTGAATFSGNLTANSFIKSGGTSSQFLKADGSVDTNTYLTTNIYNSNGTLTGNRTVTMSGNSLTFTGGQISFGGAVTGTGNTSNFTVTASGALAASKRITSTLVAAANNDVLVALDIAPTFTNGAFTGVSNLSLRTGNTLIVNPTTSFDGGVLGAELLSTSGWTSTGWTGDYTNGFTHSTGNTTALTNTLAAVNGNYYQITYTVTGRTAGTFTIAFGGYTSGNLSATGNVAPRATSTGTLSITPTTDFNGTIVISIKLITAGSASLTLSNNAGTVTNEIRASVSNTNTFIGFSAGSRNTTGLQNVAFGFQSLLNNTSGIWNTALGYQSLQNNTIGQFNVGIGAQSLQNNTTGGGNIGIGYQSLSGNTTGTGNISFAGLNTNTTGSYNFAAITNSLYTNSTGSYNIAIGYEALSFANTSNAIAIGYRAGRFIADGATGNSASSNSIFIGQNASPLASSQTNQIVIGDTTIGNGSNTVTIGNSSITATYLQGNTQITGSSSSTGNALTVRNSTPTTFFSVANGGNIQFGTAGTGLTWDNTNARLGISTSTPVVKFHISDGNAFGTSYDSNSDILITKNSTAVLSTSVASSTSSSRGVLGGSRYRGTLSSPLAVLSGDFIFSITSGAYDGSSLQNSAGIFFNAESNASVGIAPQLINLVTGTNAAGRDTRMQIRSNGNVIIQNGGTFTDAGYRLDVIGDTRIQGILETLSSSDSISSNIITTQYGGSNANIAGSFIGRKARGTSTLPTQILAGDAMGNFLAAGYHSGGAFSANTVGIRFLANENFTNTGQGTKIEFATTSNGATTRTARLTIENNGDLTYFDGGNFVLGTTTGSKIGTATSQKIGFWNATPIVQPTTAVAAATRVGGAGNTVTDTDTYDGYTLPQIVKALRNTGILA